MPMTRPSLPSGTPRWSADDRQAVRSGAGGVKQLKDSVFESCDEHASG